MWLWFARFEISQGERERARQYLARSIRRDRSNADTWRTWAELEKSAGRNTLGSQIMDHAMQLSIKNQLAGERNLPNPLKRRFFRK
eukprot:CAMPEP_0182447424 /NCGR_PEP_ID=MMETSP1172-20130603/15896_1 /TAXON_ID=708627 /ORGANISM="Timspurckia oligopyrenoides, Strain CCMP3278" /LENGTH=85 /DNA_ID=CAMNT_0024643857 /DNA_START=1 /DNA_END=258 /DNA_ORIENTATION=+